MNDRSASALEFAASYERRQRHVEARRETDSTPAGPGTHPAAPLTSGPADAPEEARVEELLREAEERAALSGRVGPDTLVDPGLDETTRLLVLSRLVAGCSVQVHGDGAGWLLLSGPRRSVLNRLTAQGRLRERLDRPLPPTDRFGEALRELLREGAEVRLEGRTHDEQLALATAVEAIAGVEVARPDPARLRASTAPDGVLADYGVLLTDGFVGREAERAALVRFVAHGDPAASERPWQGLVLTGLGGAGKSTLLARFARDVVAEPRRSTLVILDFDRPGIDPRDLYLLEAEIARQVGQQFPATAEALRALRRAARGQRAEAKRWRSVPTPEPTGEERSLRGLLVSGVRDELTRVGADALPFLLVLDTFEEVTQRNLEGHLRTWLYDVGNFLAPIPMRVVFSGRLYDRDRAELARHGVKATVEVGEFDPPLAEALLVKLKVPEPVAKRLAASDVLPLRPLELKLLARVVGDSGLSIEELERDLRTGGEATRELFLGLVYERVLQRIEDPSARALACPGLVLRYVTPALIEEVLVPALDPKLGIAALTEEEATRALDILASHEWLAYRGERGEVWHSKDLRRSTLKVMVAHDPEGAARIHEGAVRFFAEATSDREQAEGIYHRLMLARTPELAAGIELAELPRAADLIGADTVDLPPPAAALLRFATERGLARSDIPLLPPRYRKEAYDDKGLELLASRELGEALALYELLRDDPGLRQGRTFYLPDWDSEGGPPPDYVTPLESWEIETLFGTATWDVLAHPHVARSPRPYSDPLERLANLIFPTEIVAHDLVPAGEVERLLIEAAKAAEGLRRIGIGFLSEEDYQRLAMGLVLVDARAPLGPAAREAVGAIVRAVRRASTREPTPLLENRLVLLDAFAAEPAPPVVQVAPTTLRLHADWLADLSERGGEDPRVGELVAGVAAIVVGAADALFPGVAVTARTVLGAVDALAQQGDVRRGLPLPLERDSGRPEWQMRLLRGPDPEFRDPCRFALLEAFPDRAAHKDLAAIVAAAMRIELDDLAPDAFADALAADPAHALESFVELADRAWALGDLLRRAHAERPEAPKLRAVLGAYERWDSAVRRILA